MKKYLMAIDAGSGSIRAVIFDLEANQISAEQKEWTHPTDPRYPGSMDFDIKNNYGLLLSCIVGAIKKAKIDGKDIIAVSSTSMREGIILYDKDGKELWACVNVDSRAINEVKQLKEISPSIERELYAISGHTFALGALPRLLWVKNNMPEIYEKTVTLNMINDWIAYRLTGVFAVEPSNGCSTGMFNLKNKNWDSSIIKRCNIKEGIYPPVLDCGSVIGNVKKEVAEQTGLSEDCVVVVGGGDTQLGCIGIGVVMPQQSALFGGSHWQLVSNVTNPVPDEKCRIRVNYHAVPNLWQYESIAFSPGLALRWFRDAFCHLEKLLESQTGVDAYYLLDKAAASVPAGSNGLICTFSDIMNNIAWKHAAPSFINFSIDSEKFNKTVFYRSMLENAALISFGHAKTLESITGNYPEEIIFASGAAKSDLWCAIVADTLGIPVKVPKIKEDTALGAAILAGIGAGVYDDLVDTAVNFCEFEKTYEPDMKNHEMYMDLFERWRKVYKTGLENSDKGITNFMWKAPGL